MELLDVHLRVSLTRFEKDEQASAEWLSCGGAQPDPKECVRWRLLGGGAAGGKAKTGCNGCAGEQRGGWAAPHGSGSLKKSIEG